MHLYNVCTNFRTFLTRKITPPPVRTFSFHNHEEKLPPPTRMPLYIYIYVCACIQEIHTSGDFFKNNNNKNSLLPHWAYNNSSVGKPRTRPKNASEQVVEEPSDQTIPYHTRPITGGSPKPRAMISNDSFSRHAKTMQCHENNTPDGRAYGFIDDVHIYTYVYVKAPTNKKSCYHHIYMIPNRQ